MTRLVRPLFAALAFVAVSSLPASATIEFSALNCGKAECVEVWQFTCASSNLVVAQVKDINGIPSGDLLMISMFATSPASIKGHADLDIDPRSGLLSPGAFLNTANNTTISGFVMVTSLADAGSAQYELSIICQSKTGILRDPATFKRVQDQ